VIDEKQEGEESFAELFEQSMKTERREVHPGEKVSGRVMQVGVERVIVDLGDGIDGMIDLSDLAEKGEKSTVKVGDKLEAFVIKLENRVAVLAKTLGRGHGAKLALEEAARTGIPVEGLVAEVNKGGYVIDIAGTRCFCPLGQMDVRRIEDPNTMIGQRLTFQVQEVRGKRDMVVSRRALLEREQAEKAAVTRKSLEVGARFTGVVSSVRDFGAFVDIGGLDGLVPASELSYSRQRPQEVVHSGQTVEVQVLRIEPPGPKDRSERITLSMRALSEDPWAATVADIPIGSVVRGTVVRLQPFGAFVEIVPGVDGLIHVSAFGRRVAQPSEVVSVGDTVAVQIESIDTNQKRISLSYVDPSDLLEPLVPETAAAAEPEATPAAPGAAPRAPKGPITGPGMRLRRTEKPAEEAKPAPSASAKASTPTGEKARMLGRTAPAASASGEAPAARAAPPQSGQVVEVTVDKIETYGLLVKWATHRGLVPTAELELPKGGDLKKAFPVGTTFKAAVTEVRNDGRIRLSAKGAAQEEERAEARNWMQSQKGPAKGFGTLGDLLRNKLGQ
jgi:small subunit ribosomal protein S1